MDVSLGMFLAIARDLLKIHYKAAIAQFGYPGETGWLDLHHHQPRQSGDCLLQGEH